MVRVSLTCRQLVVLVKVNTKFRRLIVTFLGNWPKIIRKRNHEAQGQCQFQSDFARLVYIVHLEGMMPKDCSKINKEAFERVLSRDYLLRSDLQF